jgi:DNA-binding CsgD family transcriptional regulator
VLQHCWYVVTTYTAGVPSRSVSDALLELIGETIELLDLEQFRSAVLTALHRAIPADWIGLSDVGPDARSVFEVIDPPVPAEVSVAFGQLAHQNPLVRRVDETRDGRAYRFSDLVTAEELHELEIYERVYRPIRLEYQIAFTLQSDRDRILAIHLSRQRRDFSDAERDLLNAARPFLIQAYRNSLRYSATRPDRQALPEIGALRSSLGLTQRQAEVLQLLATGAAERDIAQRLGLSHRTVQKHLQMTYRRLGVHSRSQAAATAWSV